MRAPKRKRAPSPPLNVRLVIDNVEYPCDVLRKAEADAYGCFAWIAVPRTEIPPCAPERVCVIASVLPPGTMLIAGIPAIELRKKHVRRLA